MSQRGNMISNKLGRSGGGKGGGGPSMYYDRL